MRKGNQASRKEKIVRRINPKIVLAFGDWEFGSGATIDEWRLASYESPTEKLPIADELRITNDGSGIERCTDWYLPIGEMHCMRRAHLNILG